MLRYGSIVFQCSEPDCVTEIVFRRDDHLPAPGWICPACEDLIAEQQMEDFYRRAQTNLGLIPPLPRAAFEESQS